MNTLKTIKSLMPLCAIMLFMVACEKKEGDDVETPNSILAELQAKVDEYAPVTIEADLSHLTEREKKLVAKLAEAGKICDALFWQQSCHDAITVRDSLGKLTDAQSKLMSQLVKIYYGPYDKMNEYKRFVGDGAEKRPAGGGFYPEDMTKEEFEKHITANPKDKADFESLYTVIVRDENNKLKAIPYHQYYKETEKLATLLDEAAELCDNPSLKNYLKLRAEATRTDKYFESDWAWMELKDNNIDVIIGPIESYEDGLYNYKTAYEVVVMVKDVDATKELEMYKQSIDEFQKQLPWNQKYYVKVQASGAVLQVANVAYYAGDCNKASKSIAAALPNDPAVYEKTGGKKSMFKNLMEAKFDKILKPIADIMLAPDMRQYVSKKHMISFVTLHEISHNLGRGYVYKNEKLTVKSALKEKYSAIEELKADICAVHSQKVLFDQNKYTQEDLTQSMVTYVAGLFRSMRFGVESAHGIANFIQFRYLLENGAILKTSEGYYTFNSDKFFEVVADLAKLALEIEADGSYKKACELVEKYGNSTPEIMQEFERVKSVPRDLSLICKY